MENKFIEIMNDAIANVEKDRDHWTQEVLDRTKAFRSKAATIEPHCIFAMHSEMDAVNTANQRVREDNVLLSNLRAIRSRMLSASGCFDPVYVAVFMTEQPVCDERRVCCLAVNRAVPERTPVTAEKVNEFLRKAGITNDDLHVYRIQQISAEEADKVYFGDGWNKSFPPRGQWSVVDLENVPEKLVLGGFR